MYVLAFDPGESTGFAVVDSDYKTHVSGTFGKEQLGFWIEFLARNFPVKQIINEAFPPRSTESNEPWRVLHDALLKAFPGAIVFEASPGFWKPLRHTLAQDGDSFGTDHEKDAVHLARFRMRQLLAQKVK